MARLILPSFNKGELSPELHGRVDVTAYQGGLATARNVHVHSYGGVSRRPGTKYLGPVKDHSYAPRLIPFEFKTEDSYILEFGNQYMRVIRNDAHVVTFSVSISGITKSSNAVLTTASAHGYSNGEEVFISGVVGMTQVNGNRYKISDVTSTSFRLLSQFTGLPLNTSGFDSYTSGGTVSKVFELATPYLIEDVWELDYVQSADVMTIVHPEYEERELSRTGHDSWALSMITPGPTISAPTGGQSNSGPATTSYTYAVTAVHKDTEEESEPHEFTITDGDTGPPGDVNLSWNAVTDASKYRLYRKADGTFGFVVETTETSGIDDNITDANVDKTQYPPTTRDPFVGAGNFPGAVGFFQQRRVFGGSNNKPDTSDYSQTASFNNFNFSNPLLADDAIQASLNSEQVNRIRHYVSLSDLVILTSGAEWRINSGSENVFGPNTIRQFPQSDWGSSFLQPIVAAGVVLFVTEDEGNVRSFGYDFTTDIYKGNNLNILSRHLLQGYSISDWTRIRNPDPRIYLVRSDGIGLTLSFDPEQELVAWTRMDTLGDFEAVQSLRGGGTFSEDSVYWVVRRRVSEVNVRYIEVMRDTWFDDPEDCFFVDSGLSYDNETSITNVEAIVDTGVNKIRITAPSHGLIDGDIVHIHDIKWETSINTKTGETTIPNHLDHEQWIVADATTDRFTIQDEDGNFIDGSSFATYIEDGRVEKAVDTVVGLEHLEGIDVVCLCDGNLVLGKTVSNASVSFDRKFSTIHVGLPNVAEIETLNIEGGQNTIQGLEKKITNVTLRLFKTRGLQIGPDKDNLIEMKQREAEVYGEHTALFTGDKKIYIEPNWGTNGRLFIRQKNPLPLTLLAVIPEFEQEDTRIA